MRTIIIGAGIGGLSAAIALAAAGEPVSVLERQPAGGGKLRAVMIDGEAYDGCATVMTMAWVFQELYAQAGHDFASECPMLKLDVLARHYWAGGDSLDLFADQASSIDAVGRFAGRREALGFQDFMAAARSIHDSLKQPFLKSQRPSPFKLATGMPLQQFLRIRPFDTLWSALRKHFADPRLLQLFGRYATYCGSSPFQAPATLMMIAHVEAEGVWRVQGGMAQLAQSLHSLAEKLGVVFHFGSEAANILVERGRVQGVVDGNGQRHACTNVVFNGDPSALAQGMIGEAARNAVDAVAARDRSLSAHVWCGKVPSSGLELAHHTVFFSKDYEKEFQQLRHGIADAPTVYVCDQGNDRKQVLVNAAAGTAIESASFKASVARTFSACGLVLDPAAGVEHTPDTFSHLYPGTAGALYGRALNSWNATFQRPQARTRMQGLYLAGGATHPGPGVSMAALSGMRAAEALLADRALTRRFHRTAIAGGTLTP